MTLQLNLVKDHFEGRVYQLLFSPSDNSFFVAVTSPEGKPETPTGVVITILTAEQHEADRGPLEPHHLLRAAELALGESGYATLRTLLLQRLEEAVVLSAPLSTEPRDVSVIDFLTRGGRAALSTLTYPTLLTLARALLSWPDRIAYKGRLRKRLPKGGLPYRKGDVKVMLHYVTSSGDRRCLRLSNPSVPEDHLLDHGLANIHTHRSFWTWMAKKLETAGIQMEVSITSIEVYVYAPGAAEEAATVELDLTKEVRVDEVPAAREEEMTESAS
ncbi:hypothetical protein [Rubrivivax gelatinosus]|uniref:hypothetical protein n=1 Tax=Rubrivivax gelatinosus TaxID=28068 RepID=UPI0012FE3869|nr:hypothetical protein [Rubrivivax gelatinosus]MBG6083189.1 hypothetical protein [Rubrivivax gelatinosus]